jgi:hypothetical protein
MDVCPGMTRGDVVLARRGNQRPFARYYFRPLEGADSADRLLSC